MNLYISADDLAVKQDLSLPLSALEQEQMEDYIKEAQIYVESALCTKLEAGTQLDYFYLKAGKSYDSGIELRLSRHLNVSNVEVFVGLGVDGTQLAAVDFTVCEGGYIRIFPACCNNLVQCNCNPTITVRYNYGYTNTAGVYDNLPEELLVLLRSKTKSIICEDNCQGDDCRCRKKFTISKFIIQEEKCLALNPCALDQSIAY